MSPPGPSWTPANQIEASSTHSPLELLQIQGHAWIHDGDDKKITQSSPLLSPVAHCESEPSLLFDCVLCIAESQPQEENTPGRESLEL